MIEIENYNSLDQLRLEKAAGSISDTQEIKPLSKNSVVCSLRIELSNVRVEANRKTHLVKSTIAFDSIS